MDVALSSAPPSVVEVDLLAVGVSEPAEDALVSLLGDFGSRMHAWLVDRKFEGKPGTSVVVPRPQL